MKVFLSGLLERTVGRITLMAIIFFLLPYFDNIELMITVGLVILTLILTAYGIASTTKKRSILYYILAVYVLSNFVIFPYVYAYLLNSNAGSIRVDNEIWNNTRSEAFDELQSKITYESHTRIINVIDSILNTHHPILNKPIRYIMGDTIAFLDNHILARSEFEVKDYRHPPLQFGCIGIYNRKGNPIFNLNNHTIESWNIPIVKALVSFKSSMGSEINYFEKKREAIFVEGKFWSYLKVLPYSMNAFATSTFTPISRMASLIHSVHQIIFYGGILSLLVNVVYSIVAQVPKNVE